MRRNQDALTCFQEEITRFLFLEDEPRRADIIFVPGNGCAAMAERAALLWREGFAPYVLPSGKYSVTRGAFYGEPEDLARYPGDYDTEWAYLRRILLENGVSDEAILREDRATNTYENAIFSVQTVEEAGVSAERAIICCRNYHARRCLMYYQLMFPDTEFLVCPSSADGISRTNWSGSAEGIGGVMGELQRIIYQFNILMKYEERDYGKNCQLYDRSHQTAAGGVCVPEGLCGGPGDHDL